MGHISAQTDTLGEDDIGFWVNGVLARRRTMQAPDAARSVWQPPAFHQGRLQAHVTRGGAELRICVLQPHTAWGMEPHGVKPGYQRAKHSLAPKRMGNPWTKYESSFPGSSLYSYWSLAHSLSDELYVLESFSSWVRFLSGANCLSLESNECALANILGYVDFLAETLLFHCLKTKSGFVLLLV